MPHLPEEGEKRIPYSLEQLLGVTLSVGFFAIEECHKENLRLRPRNGRVGELEEGEWGLGPITHYNMTFLTRPFS